MLIEFKVANFRSIKDEQTLSFVASRDQKHLGSTFEPVNGLRLLKAVALYGANASGKSNIIRAIDAMDSFVENSATLVKLGDKIPVAQPFLLDSESEAQPTRFHVSLIVNGTTYEYGFSVTPIQVHDEELIREPDGRAEVIFKRTFDPQKNSYIWDFGKSLSAAKDLLTEHTRNNALVLSRGADLNVAPLTDVFLWFKERLFVYDLSIPPVPLAQMTGERCLKDEEFKQRVRELLRDADFGIDDLSIESEKVEIPEGLGLYSKKLVEILAKERPKVFSVHSVRRAAAEGQLPTPASQKRFDFEKMESNGTQRFFALLQPWLYALDHGGVIFVDELECSLHPMLVRRLVRYFQSSKHNTTGAQLVFATQDITLMDPALFRRDQVWLVDKLQNQATTCQSLYDIEERPRNGEAFMRNYLAGRYGGIPIFAGDLERAEDEDE